MRGQVNQIEARPACWPEIFEKVGEATASFERLREPNLRRPILSRLLLLLPFLLLSGAAQATQAQVPEVREAVVVGGGLAGLSATRDLIRAGVDAIIFEGQDRFGGRVMTVDDPFGLGLRINAGAELVDSTHTEIRALARELNVMIVDRPVASIENRVEQNGRWVSESDYLRAVSTQDARALSALAKWSATEDVSLAHKLRSVGASAMLQEYVARAVESEWGRSTEQLNRQVFFDTFGVTAEPSTRGPPTWRIELLPHNDEKSFFARGSESLVEALVQKIPESSRALGWKLKSLEERLLSATANSASRNQRTRYRLTLQNDRGETRVVETGKVILAMPEASLREVAFKVPGLPQDVSRSNSQWARNSKIVLYFKARDWAPFAGLARDPRGGLAYQMWDSSLDARGPGAAITLYTGRLANRAQVESAVQHALNLLRSRGEGAHYVGYATHEWERSYPGADRPGPKREASRVQRHGEIYFAGDAWSESHKGYMNGAVEAGRARALEILLTSGRQCAVMFR
ncbi:MAG TPA: FAD-dependent oxidoreductase [Pseudobdellovibrionaceae bacterium]|nr:FAD-dependent oxidoreductase [Pseudobdellovibrionaceae bacterium]